MSILASGCSFLTSFATSNAPWACGSQCRSIPKTAESSLAMTFSTSSCRSFSIMLARLMIRTRKPASCNAVAMVVNPIGYISKTGVEGTRSLTGP